MRASQRRAGSPIKIAARFEFDPEEYAAEQNYGFGVTPTATEPTNSSTFSHVANPLDNGKYVGTNTQLLVDGDETDYLRVSVRGVQAVDADFAVGKYVWAFSELSAGVIQFLSDPYLIV